MDKKKIVRRLLDADTGEVIEFYEGDRIIRESSIKKIDENEKLDIKHFFMGNIEELILLLPELSMSEKGLLISLIPYVGYHDCCLKFKNGRELNTNNILEISNINKKTVHSIVNSLLKKDIIYKGKNSNNRQYFVNPWLFNKGVVTNKVLKTMFKNYKIRSKNNIKWKDLK